jgi:hypothetical protein
VSDETVPLTNLLHNIFHYLGKRDWQRRRAPPNLHRRGERGGGQEVQKEEKEGKEGEEREKRQKEET